VGGVSSGCGIAVRFAIRHPARAAALVLVRPISGGTAHGYTIAQKAVFAKMDAASEDALENGVARLASLYSELPPGVREKALAMAAGFDAASVRATTRFLVSGAHPFGSGMDLRGLTLPSLLARGVDALHPAEVSDLYAANLPRVTVVPAGTVDVTGAIDAFLDATG
jgi:pimeloyl-ACP methyl ester carboxylesterase